MFKNHLKIAFRNLGRSKVFAGINILGLALGLAVFILIMLWVLHETSYDGFHKDKERIAAIMTNQSLDNGEKASFPAVPSKLAAALQNDLPEVEWAATCSWGDERQFSYGEKKFKEYGLYVSPEFLKVFTFPLLKGDPDKVLREPHTLVLTESLAKKYFGDEDPMGKTILVEQGTAYKVVGLLKDIPGQATLTFDFLAPVSDYIEFTMGGNESWDMYNMRAYLKLKPGVDRGRFDRHFAGVLSKYTDTKQKYSLMLWNLEDWYLRNDFKNGKYGGGGRITYVRLFIAIAFFILLLACINFMNLSTARAAHRSKEVGVRKVIGAGKRSLVSQFMTESVLMAFLAGLLALAIVSFILPSFNTFLRKSISIDYSNPWYILVFVCILTGTGLLAGSYPSWVLSAFRPIQVLKQVSLPSSTHATWIRKGLVVLQFAVSILLVIGTLVVARQVDYIRNRELGYAKDHLVWFANNIPAEKNETAIREMTKVPGVTNVSLASMTFTQSNNRGSEVSWAGKQAGQDVFFSFIAGSNDIVRTMGLSIIQGRDFSENYLQDTGAILLNEESVKRMGLKDPIGQELAYYGGKGRVVGVVKDFHFESMHNPIAPVIILCRPDWTWNMYVRIDGKDIARTLAGLEETYKQMAPGYVFEYNFQDKEYERLYRSETQIGTLVRWFAALAIIISCLGLLGLTAYSVERKNKEIGVRKVLGASVGNVVYMVMKQFIILVGVAFLLAVLPGWYLMNDWLQQYAYRTQIDWKIFAIAGIMALVVAVCTISVLAIRAATANPVKSLRTE